MSLELCVLASGSSGNCSVVRAPGGVILIDAGIGPRTTAKRMNGTGVSLRDVRAICLTHLDSDHFNANWVGTIQHGLPEDLLRPSYEPGSYLAFLGRLTAEKGPEDAIRIARAAGKPLRIAAKIPRAETAYFRKHLEPHLDGKRVELVGEVDEARKQCFLADAAALLFPIDWPEPFGLVMIEAMACGTPVIAYRSGSVPEVVEDGVTGFIVENEEGAVAAVGRLGLLDRRIIRARFEERFSARRMVREYERQYRKLVADTDGARRSQ